MSLNKQKGNMYPFVTHTWNTVKGICPHDCSYCYMKQYPQGPVRFDRSELKTNLGRGNFIFVGSSCDMWADSIPEDWIIETLDYCKKYNNKYFFQTKNPDRFFDYLPLFPKDVMLCITMESDRWYTQMGKTPSPLERFVAFSKLMGFKKSITVEPIMDFTLRILVEEIELCDPKWVSIGADSKKHKLIEPPKEKILELINELKKFTEVILKDNLRRIIGGKDEKC